MILRPFDPWKCQLCTCPPKMSLNPYTGCPHGCLYCYASSYIPHFQECRAKADLLRRLEREAKKINPNTLVAMSNSSDPYPAMEKELELSRGCLQILLEKNLPVQVITKSDLVIRERRSAQQHEVHSGHQHHNAQRVHLSKAGARCTISLEATDGHTQAD